MTQNEWIVLSECPLFYGCERAALSDVLIKAHAYKEDFVPGDVIRYQSKDAARIGIVLRGKLVVQSAPESDAILNALSPGNCFGVSVLYQSCGAKTLVRCQKNASVLFFDTDHLGFFWEDPLLRQNLIRFLTDRIRFLNQKSACFTASDAATKLVVYLLANTGDDKNVCRFTSFAALARSLDLGRASLYRALDALESAGAIQKGSKQITVLSREKLDLLK